MPQSGFDSRPKPDAHPTQPFWQDLLINALAGLYPTDQQLEHMLDRLERMP